MVAWRLYYRDGSTYDSVSGPWDEAPTEGVLVVVENRDGRVTLHMGADHYQLEDDGTIVMRDARTLIANIGRVSMSRVLFGWYVSASQMERAIERARQDWGL
jgi:hypothetical protein